MITGYMCFMPEVPICSNLRIHPAFTVDRDPYDRGDWVEAYSIFPTQEEAEAEAADFHQMSIDTHGCPEDALELDDVLPVRVDELGTVYVDDDRAVITALEMFSAFH